MVDDIRISYATALINLVHQTPDGGGGCLLAIVFQISALLINSPGHSLAVK